MNDYELHLYCAKVYLIEAHRYRLTTGRVDELFLKMAANQRLKALACRPPQTELF